MKDKYIPPTPRLCVDLIRSDIDLVLVAIERDNNAGEAWDMNDYSNWEAMIHLLDIIEEALPKEPNTQDDI